MSEANSKSEINNAQSLLDAYAKGDRSFMGVSLARENLSYADLKGADLSYADLSSTNLSHANLRGVDLSYANLSKATLNGANLRGAMLIGTDLRNATLDSAVLEQADYDPESTHFPTSFNPVAAGLRADRKV